MIAKPTPVVRRLRELACEFDSAAVYYGRFSGGHNNLLRDEAQRSAAQLRLVAFFVSEGSYTQIQGVMWLRAAWRIINAIGRANLS